MKEKKTILKTVNDDIFGDISIIESTKLMSFRNIEIINEIDNYIYTNYNGLSLIKTEKKSIEIISSSSYFFDMTMSNLFDTDISRYVQFGINDNHIRDCYLCIYNSKPLSKKVHFVKRITLNDIKYNFDKKYKNIIQGLDIIIDERAIYMYKQNDNAYNVDKNIILPYKNHEELEKFEQSYYSKGDKLVTGFFIALIPKLIRNDEELDGNLLKEW